MALADHYALLLTINRYPGLQDLQGPENDGQAFKDWLLDPQGGDVDPTRVQHLKSSDFGPMNDPYDANPTERALVRALDRWMRHQGDWVDKVGTRLYLYFAGHGFTAGSSISDPALFSAVAQSGDPAHIAGYRYAAKIANAGFFDEIVLVMDCCQDVLKASQVLEPTWSPPDRNQAARVKLMQAYGAPRGRKAFERTLTPGSGPHGLFSSVWIEALGTAAADAEGWVTGQAVKNQVLNLWNQRFRGETGYDPPVRLPDGADIRLLRRAAVPLAAPLAAAPAPVATPALRPLGTTRGRPRIGAEADLAGSSRNSSLRPTSTRRFEVELSAADEGADIVVVDALSNKVGSAARRLSVKLKPGDYTALVKAAGATLETAFSVGSKALQVELPPLPLSSAAPLDGSVGRHEYQMYPAHDAAAAPVRLSAPQADGELFVFVRDSQHVLGGAPLAAPWPAGQLRVAALQQTFERPLFEGGFDAARGFAFDKLALQAGSHALLLDQADRPASMQTGLVVPVLAGWRTEVYLDCSDADADADANADNNGAAPTVAAPPRQPELSSAAVFVVPAGSPSLLLEPLGRTTEIARARLASGRPGLPPASADAARSPMLALLAAYASWVERPDDVAAIRRCLAGLAPGLREAWPDLRLLDRWCARATAAPRAAEPAGPVRGVPMLAAAWRLAARLPAGLGLHPQAQSSIGQWRLAGSVWTHWQQPVDRAAELRDALRRACGGTAEPTPARHRGVRGRGAAAQGTPQADEPMAQLSPAWSLSAWEPVAAGLRSPDPLHSPFQQALRRRLLDALADQAMPPEGVYPLAAQFGLQPAQAASAYLEVYRGAKGALGA